MQLILDTAGLTLNTNKGAFEITKNDQKRRISPKRVTSIAITSHCIVHTQALQMAAKNEIPVILFNRIGKAYSRMWSPYFVNLAELRKQQWRFGESTESTKWIIDLFSIKTNGQVNNLRWLSKKTPKRAEHLKFVIHKMQIIQKTTKEHENTLLQNCRLELMGLEGSIARLYFQAMSSCMPKSFQFNKRSRRPALDPFNAALNYLYGMTYSVVEGGLFASGLDGQQGLLHADVHKKMTLSFDLIEPFRPWIDKLLMEQCFDGHLKDRFFTKNQFGLHLNKYGKAFIIPLFNDFMANNRDFQEQTLLNKNHIYHLAWVLANRVRTFNAENLK